MSFSSRLNKQPAHEPEHSLSPSTIRLAASAPERYCCGDIIRFPVGDKSELVYSRVNRSAQILPSQVARLLDCCRIFKTLDEHARECYRNLKSGQDQVESIILELSAQSLPPSLAKLVNRVRSYAQKHSPGLNSDRARIESIKNQLSELVKAGLLIPDIDLIKMCRQSAESQNAPERIASVGVVTRNRIDSLKRCLISHIENSKQNGRENDFIVMDDSEDFSNRDNTRQMLLLLKTHYDVEISYAGLEEKVRFANTLIDRGLPPDVVDFALFDVEKCGCSIGANRNGLLLHTIGDLVLSADDDTMCRIAAAPESRDGLAFDSSNGFMQFWFFPDRESAMRSAAFADKDILAIHERLLGRDLGSCISALSETTDLNLDQISSRFLRGLQSGNGRVLVTFTGLIGDSGMPSPSGYLVLSPDSRKRLLQTKSDYLSACTSRELLRAVNRPTVTDNIWCCMTTALGYDNRALLPPFMPVLRNGDIIFGFTLRSCFKNGYFGHLPWAILHAPMEARLYSSDGIWQIAPSLQTSSVIVACMASLESRPNMVDGKEKLLALGKHLMEVGSMTLPDFEEFVRIKTWESKSTYIAMLENQLQIYKELPAFWADDIKKHLELTRKAIPRKEYIVPGDLLNSRSIEEARQLTQRLVFKFGQFLYWWPEIVEIAKNLRAQGQRLAATL